MPDVTATSVRLSALKERGSIHRAALRVAVGTRLAVHQDFELRARHRSYLLQLRYCGRGRVLRFDPIRRVAGLIARSEPLGNDALQTELAGVTEHGVLRLPAGLWNPPLANPLIGDIRGGVAYAAFLLSRPRRQRV